MVSLYDFCMENGKQTLLAQWSGQNAPLTPQTVGHASRKRVWWRCENGHTWQAAVCNRTAGYGCPVCAGRIAKPGENTLADRFPALAQEWDFQKNAPLTPSQVMPGSTRRVWWLCANGHSWKTRVSARTSAGSGCPVCAGKLVQAGETDLSSRFPVLAAQWDFEKNAGVRPSDLTAYSNRRVWWRCEKGHSYMAAVSARVRTSSGCPYCAGRKVLPGFNDLATKKPLVAAQWDFDLNGDLTPQSVSAGSRNKVWWRCSQGHRWRAAIYARTAAKGTECPVCAGQAKRSEVK